MDCRSALFRIWKLPAASGQGSSPPSLAFRTGRLLAARLQASFGRRSRRDCCGFLPCSIRPWSCSRGMCRARFPGLQRPRAHWRGSVPLRYSRTEIAGTRRLREPDRTAGARSLFLIVTAWRIVKRKYAKHAFSGDGARLYGGRWNKTREQGLSMRRSRNRWQPWRCWSG